MTPPQLAEECERGSREVLRLVSELRTDAGGRPASFSCELDDLEAWACLGMYMAEKIRGGVALARFRLRRAAIDKSEA